MNFNNCFISFVHFTLFEKVFHNLHSAYGVNFNYFSKCKILVYIKYFAKQLLKLSRIMLAIQFLLRSESKSLTLMVESHITKQSLASFSVYIIY